MVIIDASVSIDVVLDHKTPLSCLPVVRRTLVDILTTYEVALFISRRLRQAE